MSLKQISEKIINWQRSRQAIRELSKLSDHALADLGINRGDIETVAKVGFRRS